MRLSLFLASLMATSSSAFNVGKPGANFGLPATSAAASATAIGVSASDVGAEVPLVVTGNNIDLTPSINDYIDKRIGNPLRKLASGGFVRDCDVHLSVNKNPKVKNAHRVDLTANLKGLTIHCKEETPDMYNTIDSIAHALNRKLLKYKERRQKGYHSGNSMGEDLMVAIEAMEEELAVVNGNALEAAVEDFIDPEAPSITKIDSFDLETPVPIKEAIFALDYVDHDFYVFKNEDSGKLNIVYKRNAGGVGQIEL